MRIFKVSLIALLGIFVFVSIGYCLKAERGQDGYSIDFNFREGKSIVSTLTLDGLSIKDVTLSGSVLIKGKLLKDKDGSIRGISGRLISRNVTINSNPLDTLTARFKLTKDELKIYSLSFGQSYYLKGTVSLREPFESEFYVEIKKAHIRDIALLANAKNPDRVLGIMSGIFTIKGPLRNLATDGFIEGRSGIIGPIRYDTADIKVQGFGPIISIVDSKVKQAGLTLMLEGYIDLRNICKGTLFDGLLMKSDMKTIAWEGWDISKSAPNELSITRDIADDVKVGFKTVARDPLPAYQKPENPEEMSLEYMLGNKESFNMKLKENEEFFGVEHKTKF